MAAYRERVRGDPYMHEGTGPLTAAGNKAVCPEDRRAYIARHTAGTTERRLKESMTIRQAINNTVYNKYKMNCNILKFIAIFTEIKSRQMRARHILALLLCLAACIPAAYAATTRPTGPGQAVSRSGQDGFQAYFSDSTLRIDCILAGSSDSQAIYVDELYSFAGWAGRRHNLDTLPLRGNGQVELTDEADGKTIYISSFSTLFQEWQTTLEATTTRQSFENVLLVPMPKRPATLHIRLFDTHGKVCATLRHRIDPDDILIHRLSPSAPGHRYLLKSGSAEDCIDVAIVAEGYTEDEKERFYSHAQTAVSAILSHEPFKSYRDRFNFVAVALESKDSGVSVPAQDVWKDTALESNFSTFHMDRYLTTRKVGNIADRLCGIPYEHIVILANTETYGGGGIYNFYTLTTSLHDAFEPVVVHEFGHSFAGLADEYYYDDMYSPYYHPDTEPWEQNITTLADFTSKWEDMLPEGTTVPTPAVEDASLRNALSAGEDAMGFVGVYEGAGYMSKGAYRPYPDCRMKTNGAPGFCPVCRRAIERMILFYTE